MKHKFENTLRRLIAEMTSYSLADGYRDDISVSVGSSSSTAPKTSANPNVYIAKNGDISIDKHPIMICYTLMYSYKGKEFVDFAKDERYYGATTARIRRVLKDPRFLTSSMRFVDMLVNVYNTSIHRIWELATGKESTETIPLTYADLRKNPAQLKDRITSPALFYGGKSLCIDEKDLPQWINDNAENLLSTKAYLYWRTPGGGPVYYYGDVEFKLYFWIENNSTLE